MLIENFQLPVWIVAAQDGRLVSTVRDGKQFVPVCDNEVAASVFIERNRQAFPGNVIAKPVSSLAQILRVLLDSQKNGCTYAGRVRESGSMLLLPISDAIAALQEKHKEN